MYEEGEYYSRNVNMFILIGFIFTSVSSTSINNDIYDSQDNYKDNKMFISSFKNKSKSICNR